MVNRTKPFLFCCLNWQVLFDGAPVFHVFIAKTSFLPVNLLPRCSVKYLFSMFRMLTHFGHKLQSYFRCKVVFIMFYHHLQ